MSAALSVPFLMPRVEEVVPDFAMLKDRLTGSSVVEERYTATQVPSSGDSYTVGGSGTKLMIIRIANQNDYIDTSTMVLNFKVVAGSTPTGTAIDDHIFSLVDTINVKVGGQTIEVLNNVGHLVNALVQGSMPNSYYEKSGGAEGLYVYSKANDNTGTAVDNTCDWDNSPLLKARNVIGCTWLTKGRYYSVPLTLLGLCRIPTLFAARNFQDITLEILFKSNLAGAVWTASANTPGAWGLTGQINISDVTLTYDCCRMSADYYALMDNELKMPNGSGVAYAIDTYQVQPATLAPTSVAINAVANGIVAQAAQLSRIVVAKGTRFLKAVYGVTRPTIADSSVAWRNNSHNGNFGFYSYQVVINSKRFPQLQVQSSALQFQELQKAYNLLGSVASGSPICWANWVGQPALRTINVTGTVTTVTDATLGNQDLVTGSSKDGSTLGFSAGDECMFQNGVNLEQFLTGAPESGGINTSTSGYQIAVELANRIGVYNLCASGGQVATNAAASQAAPMTSGLTHYVILHFTRVLTLKAGAVEILD